MRRNRSFAFLCGKLAIGEQVFPSCRWRGRQKLLNCTRGCWGQFCCYDLSWGGGRRVIGLICYQQTRGGRGTASKKSRGSNKSNQHVKKIRISFFCRGCYGGCCWLGAWKEETYLIEIFAKNCWLSSTEVRSERAFKYSFKECFFAKEFFDYYFLILSKHLKVDDRASAMHFKYLGCQKRFELLKKKSLHQWRRKAHYE